MAAITPVIPENITVHLGAPSEQAENVTVPFTEYIKNVASSELYPTWPENALRANIYAIITYTLNRVYTEWYLSMGYDFDITSNTAYDQAFVKNREVFENISVIVDEIFNNYVVRQGSIAPLFTQYCNGTTSTCPGLSQWGTVPLAEQGYTPYRILQNFYGDDIGIVENAPVQNVDESYPGYPLQQGSFGNEVSIISLQLNRIGENYPAIPRITSNTAVFDQETQDAVREFQRIFNLPVTGIVDKSTWYKIKQYYNGVKRLGELNSEGLSYDELNTPYQTELSEGSTGVQVSIVQYYLNVIAYFNPNLNLLPLDGNYGWQTTNAVRAFQEEYGLPVTGVVNRETWNKIRSVYNNILPSLPEGYEGGKATLYPGYALTVGSTGENVRNLQTYLQTIAEATGQIPYIAVDGIYGNATRDAVYTFQRINGLPIIGYVGPATWFAIASQYDRIIENR